MLDRRHFLGTVGTGLISASGFLERSLARAAEPAGLVAPRKKLAIVTTEWRYHSHAWHMGERFLVGYPHRGVWHQPPFEVVSAYVDQFPENDLSRGRAAEFGFKIYPPWPKPCERAGRKLAVDAVLIIGEHGNYPDNELGQKKYPRYEFFKQATDVFRADGRAVPMFKRQASVVEMGVGQGNGRHVARVEVSASGRLFASGHVAHAVGRHASRGRR